ncbi:MAG: C4-dicarboxylate TRAP transporter large permease protein DctM [Hyphomicrobiaceae bacterium hypho_1]
MQEYLALFMILGFMLLLLVGIPVGIGIAVAGLIFGWIGFGDFLFNLSPARIYGVCTKYEFIAIPLFIFMGVMLEKSRVAEDMLDMIGRLSGRLHGSMAIALVIVGVLMGASTGIVGATVVTLTMFAVPMLIRRGYDAGITAGVVCASGTLGQIIPPSLVLILLADIMGVSVGTLFAAAVTPGLLLALLYIAYILLLGFVQPGIMPLALESEKNDITGLRLAIKAMIVLASPMSLVIGVLGSIITGIAAPTEAASVGAVFSILIALAYRRFTFTMLWSALNSTLRISAMIFFILISAQIFSIAFRGLNGDAMIERLLAFLPGDELSAVIFLMLLIFILGFFLEWIEISYIALPLLLPFFKAQGVDMIWLATLIAINLQTSFLTPPFGWALFFFRGAAPPQIKTEKIYRGVLPFILIQALLLFLLLLYPKLSTWLPEAIGW